MRINTPSGFPHDFFPISQPNDGRDELTASAWWNGQGVAPVSKTIGSPLTERSNREQPMPAGSTLAAVTRCLTILTEAVVRTRWLYHDSSGTVLPRPLWVEDPMLTGSAPGPIFPLAPYGARITGHGFYTTLLADAILYGQGGFVYIEASDGTPLPGSMMLLNPFMFMVDESGHVVLDRFSDTPLRTDYDGGFVMGGQKWKVATLSGQVPVRNGWPQGVLLKHWDLFGIGVKLDRYIEDFYSSGIPSGYLSVSTPNFGQDVPDPDAPGTIINESNLLKRQWMRAHGRGRRSVAVLNSTVAYTPISLNPVDADAVKMKSIWRTDVAHAFGMSSVWLDEGMSGLNYSNSSERRADLVSLTAAGWGEKMVNMISSLLPYGTRCSVNWLEFVSASPETIMPSLVQAVQAGILSPIEARQLLGWAPWTGMDTRFQEQLTNPTPALPPAPGPTVEGEQP